MKKKVLTMCLTLALLLALAIPAAAAGEEAAVRGIAPSGLTAADGAVYIADSYNRAVWKLTDAGAELVAGRTEVTDLSGQPVAGYNDGALSEAAFASPWAVVPYADGLLVSDTENHVIRYIDLAAGQVYTAAGTGTAGNASGGYGMARLDSPTGLAVGDDGTVYIADTGNNVIRAMNSQGVITTYAGSSEGCALGSLYEARFSQPTGLCWADGILYVADTGNHRIVAIADGKVTLVAGGTLTGDAAIEGDYLNGPAETARFASPQGLVVGTDGTVYIADTGNGAVRVLRDGYVTTLTAMESGQSGPVSPVGLLLDGETLYVGDVFTRTLLTADAAGGDIVFTDVAESAWYYDAVRYTAANDIFDGVGGGAFAPDGKMTRAMVMTVLARMGGADTSNGEYWYSAGVEWAVENGISDGTYPERSATREQLAAMLMRFAEYMGYDVSAAASLEIFADGGEVSDWAAGAMSWAVGAGIIEGGDGGRLASRTPVTRAQAALMIWRFMENIGK